LMMDRGVRLWGMPFGMYSGRVVQGAVAGQERRRKADIDETEARQGPDCMCFAPHNKIQTLVFRISPTMFGLPIAQLCEPPPHPASPPPPSSSANQSCIILCQLLWRCRSRGKKSILHRCSPAVVAISLSGEGGGRATRQQCSRDVKGGSGHNGVLRIAKEVWRAGWSNMCPFKWSCLCVLRIASVWCVGVGRTCAQRSGHACVCVL
jgi:hypothetical protein